MRENRSYIFFRVADTDDPALGPLGQLEVPLTPGRSIAVDLGVHAPNLPMWLETRWPNPHGPRARSDEGSRPRPMRRLMIAQDTGSAIRGPIRVDVFFGSGAEAGRLAGHMREEGRLVVLLPACAGC